MPAIDSRRRSLQAKHAAAVRWDKPNQDDTARNLAEAKLAAYIERTVAAAPPLTAEQRDRLALSLRPAVGDAA